MKSMTIVVVAIMVCLAAGREVSAQIDEHKFEVGGFFTNITLTDFQARTSPGSLTIVDKSVSGIGGRLAYNLTNNVAVDAEASFFPRNHLFNGELGQKTQAFIGLKAGWRNKRVGAFAKARPGVMWFGEFPARGSCTSTSFGSVCGVSHEKDFAMDLGAVFELYPAERALVRLDIGDTIIRYQEQPSGPGFVGLPAATKNNLQVSIGFGWRF